MNLDILIPQVEQLVLETLHWKLEALRAQITSVEDRMRNTLTTLLAQKGVPPEEHSRYVLIGTGEPGKFTALQRQGEPSAPRPT